MKRIFACKTNASVRASLSHCSYRFYGGDVNIWSKEKDFKFVKTFMKGDDDKIKDKWPILHRYRAECRIDPMMDENKFNWTHQRYELDELHDLWMESDDGEIKTDAYVADWMNKFEENKEPLSEGRLRLCKAKLNVLKFRKNIGKLMDENRKIIFQLHIHYNYLQQQIKHWSLYRRAAYGHPYITTIHDQMKENGYIEMDKVLDVLYYIDELRRYKWKNKDTNRSFEHYDQFLATTIWFRKHDIRMKDEKYFISNTSDSLRHSLRLTDFWELQSKKYMALCKLVSEIAETKETDVTSETLLDFIGSLYSNEDDPFFMTIWNELGDKDLENDVKKRINNRWNLDIGDALTANSDVLIPILYRDNSEYFDAADCQTIDECKYNLLIGEDIQPQIDLIRNAKNLKSLFFT